MPYGIYNHKIKLTPEELKANHRNRSRQWSKDNPEKRRKLLTNWRKNNPEKAKLSERNWRANTMPTLQFQKTYESNEVPSYATYYGGSRADDW